MSDRETAGHTWPPFAVLALAFGVVLWLAVPDRVTLAVLAPALLAVAAYRRWARQRFAPRPAELHARAVVAGAASAMVPAFPRLAKLTPERLTVAAAALAQDRFPPRHLGTVAAWANRLAAAVLGGLLGVALAWVAARTGCASWLDPLVSLPWPVWAALLLALLGHALASGRNRMDAALATAAMRSRPAEEMRALNETPGRAHAVHAELDRLADHAEGTAKARPRPELTILETLLGAGVVAGLTAGLLAYC